MSSAPSDQGNCGIREGWGSGPVGFEGDTGGFLARFGEKDAG